MAGIGSAVVFIVLMLLGRIRNENRILLIIRGSRSEEQDHLDINYFCSDYNVFFFCSFWRAVIIQKEYINI